MPSNSSFQASQSLSGTAPVQSLPFETLDRSSYSGVEQPLLTVVRDQNGWSDLWRVHTRLITPAPSQPSVDLARQMVIGVFAGTKPNGCHGIQVREITLDQGVMTVRYQEETPGPQSMCAQALTAPSHLITTAAFAGEVRFLKQP
ncbi:PrcB C-terminal [Noviherbaspirillum humi]|uniref:PrcB C-terminal n=1 Tax=Noviherbaspirillum humi TaxID=1688639 RepID=A0A239DW27_9BURK|nr:PrcB C-terminal [Noviherbaspirillum humi]